ncbi:XRE family transcriptional regulator [Agrobacterium vitis]|uniref:XRE family transcriptional regulator n=1 Tax=Agrobacterium vitis TaxID=373 RepID=UPI001F3C1A9D|nr:XRE family transcriptional regulator [Agrobacterium vitis]MCF1452270.1 helix-turn-helix transcriptional regulator [Agrobacterium vitis]
MRVKKPVPANNIRTLRTARGLSMEALGALIGTDASTINKLEKGKTRLDAERLKLIADALGISPDTILAALDIEDSDMPPRLTREATLERSLADLTQALDSAKTGATEPRKLPVIGTAAGSIAQGAFQLTAEPVDYIEMPRALENAKGVYALYVVGTSMEPMFRHGSICVVSEFRPPRIGDAVVIQEKKGQGARLEASIGILESQSNNKILLRKLNPSATVELKPDYVVSIHKVLDFNEILGV